MTTLNSKVQPPLWQKGLAFLVLLLTIGLGLLAWSSLYNLVMAVTIELVVYLQNVEAMQRTGIVRTMRVLTMMCGGGLWLVVALGSFGFHTEFLGTRRSWRIMAWTIVIEMIVIGLDRLFVSVFWSL